MTQDSSSARPAGRARFVLLLALFAAPVLGAYLIYFYWPGVAPTATTNYGSLFAPIRTLPEGAALLDDEGRQTRAALLENWHYLVRAQADCDAACVSALLMTRQVRLSLNEKRERVDRLLVLSPQADVQAVAQRLAAEHPHLQVMAANPALQAWLADVAADVILLDPLGNAVLHYQLQPGEQGIQEDFKGLRKDIKKLLKLSSIG